jgi:hypothetical protein
LLSRQYWRRERGLAFHFRHVLKDALRSRRGVATKDIASYLRWFYLVALHAGPTPRYSLDAAMGA